MGMQVPPLTSFGRDDKGVSYRETPRTRRRAARVWREKLRAALWDRSIAGILRFSTPARCARRGPRFAQNDAFSIVCFPS